MMSKSDVRMVRPRACMGALQLITALAWCCWSGAVFAENAIKGLTGQLVAGQELITIEASEPVTVDPVSFSTAAPARIALDFVGFQSSVDRGSIALGLRTVRSANVIQAGDKTRVILSLQQSIPFKVVRRGNLVDVVLQEGGVSEAVQDTASPVQVAVNPVAASGVPQIRDVDFRRGQENVGRLVVDFNRAQPEVDIAVKGKTLVITVPRYELPEFLRRKLDVSDFGTPVQGVVSEPIPGGGVRITLTPRGNWEHSAFQTDGRLVVEVREQKQDPNKLVQGPGYAGDKLSLNFQSIDVRALLQVIADFTNFNIVTSDAVGGSVTLRLKDVPWDQALEIILQSKHLGMKKSGNVIWVAPLEEMAARDKAELESRVSIESMEVLKTQSFQLNYAKAADVAGQISSSGVASGTAAPTGSGQPAAPVAGSILSSRGSVIAEPRTNQLFVTDIPSRLEQIQAFITKLDVPVRQVLIEARIVEADDKFGRSLGVKLGGADLRGIRGGDAGYSIGSGNRVAVGGTYDAINATVGITDSSNLTANTANFLSLPASGLGGVTPASFALSLFSPSSNRFLNLELSALEADSRGKIVSSPRLVTADKVKAIIEQGVEFPYQTTAPNGGTTIAFKKASLKLEVTPQITPEGAVILEVEVNKDSPGEILLGARAINTKRVQTQVLVENGGTVVIGGIFESSEAEAENKVPFIGDLPVVGNLFKNRTKSLEKSEMLVFITPKVVENTQIR